MSGFIPGVLSTGGTVLYSAQFASNSTMIRSTANAAGFTCAPDGVDPSIFIITHNLNSTAFIILVDAQWADFGPGFAELNGPPAVPDPNSVPVAFFDVTGAPSDPLSFTITLIPTV